LIRQVADRLLEACLNSGSYLSYHLYLFCEIQAN
jgi:hypothetical protein